MTIGIYKITNKKTGQIYIGKSINIERRFKQHIQEGKCPKSHIDCAIKKYGKNYFNFEIIEKFDEDTPFLNDVLNDSEQYYIATYNTFEDDFHYNLTIGGDGFGFGKNHPLFGEKRPEHSKKMSGKNNPFYGKHHSEETKKKMSKAQSRENNPMYGKKHSVESKKKMSKSSIKKYATIIKDGKTSNNKQRYAIRYQGKTIKHSISIDKLLKWFLQNYPLEIIKVYKGDS